MSQSRVEIKVGLFLLLGLVLLGSLTLLFSRSGALFRDYYEVRLQSANVGGIKNGAKVLIRGVPVGYVTAAKLNPDGQHVTITLKIEAKYELYSDAQFAIEQAGFLGDQFVAIYPTADQGYVLTNRAEVVAKEPFNMQEAVTAATEMLLKISTTTTNLDAAVSDVRRLVLSEATLSSLNDSLTRFSRITEEAQMTVGNLNTLLASNVLPVTLAVSNIGAFAEQLPPLSAQAQALLATNATEITSAIKHLEASSATLHQLMTDLQEGRGAAGRLLRDEQLAADLATVAGNLSVTTSNLNRRGLWGILWKQKDPPPPKTK
jgi:phospholipid/cholesterol/gamma-HCH transport system substrate-binding protein